MRTETITGISKKLEPDEETEKQYCDPSTDGQPRR